MNSRNDKSNQDVSVSSNQESGMNIPRHAYPSEKNDRYETPHHIYQKVVGLGRLYGLDEPELDIFAEVSTAKCRHYFTEQDDAFTRDWLLPDGTIPKTIWINDPHTKHKETLEKLTEQYERFGFGVIMIIPRNVGKIQAWTDNVEKFRVFGDPRFKDCPKHIISFPHDKSIRFILDGKPTTNKRTGHAEYSRNAYEIVLYVPKKLSKHLTDLQNSFNLIIANQTAQ